MHKLVCVKLLWLGAGLAALDSGCKPPQDASSAQNVSTPPITVSPPPEAKSAGDRQKKQAIS